MKGKILAAKFFQDFHVLQIDLPNAAATDLDW